MASAPRRLSPSYLIFFSSRRRHTRYIGDWSSDVCSSDLGGPISSDKTAQATSSAIDACDADDGVVDRIIMEPRSCKFSAKRSEERRVGKECRSRGGAERVKKKCGRRGSRRIAVRSRWNGE